MAFLVVCHVMRDLTVLENLHDDGAAAMRPSVLGKVIAAGEFLAALMAFEWLVMSVKRAVVTFEMLLSTEPTRTKGAYEGFGRVFGQGLLPATTVDRCRWCLALSLRA